MFFNKKEMMNDEHGFCIVHAARKVPITLDRMSMCIDFISHYVHKQNIIIKKYEEEGKDTKYVVYERDRALYVLGLDEEPKRYWMKDND